MESNVSGDNGENTSVTAEKLRTVTWKQRGKQQNLEVELDAILTLVGKGAQNQHILRLLCYWLP